MRTETRNAVLATGKAGPMAWLKKIFLKVGVLPFLMVVCLLIFGFLSDHFLSTRNLLNVARQSSYLVIASLAQFMVLLVAGIDLSVGTIIAVASVSGAITMTGILSVAPDAVALALVLGILAGLLAGTVLGMINGFGVAVFQVQPFMMTLSMTSIGFGLALFATSGTPVTGLPASLGNVLGYGVLFGIPLPIWVALTLAAGLAFLLGRTGFGRHLYAIGGNVKAARLSGIDTGRLTFLAYAIGGTLAGVTGVMLTARMMSGEANVGATMPLETIAACVIGGASLSGGAGSVTGVILGALFISLVQNGMNLAQVDSYLQLVVIGLILIFAVIADNFRSRLLNPRG